MNEMIRNMTKMKKTTLILGLITFLAFAMAVIYQSQGRAASDQNQQIYLPVISSSIPKSAVNTFYLSPNGNDSYSGRSEAEAWATFDRAWWDLNPGDTLVLLDGVYYQTLNPNKRNGEPGKPITVMAKNDGQVVIDGQYQRIPIKIGDTWPGPINSHFVVEGIVARNSNADVVHILRGYHNVLRRVSAYNANTDTNSGVIKVSGEYNLVEDCVASGTGRKMIYTMGDHNTFRRCIADWQSWDGREWHDCWPWGDNFQVYNGNYNIAENIIALGPVPLWSISVQANSITATAIGNKVLGSIAMNAGMNSDGTPIEWGDARPEPTDYTCVRNFNWPDQRTGFTVYGSGEVRDNLFQDIFSWGNAGLGFSEHLVGIYANNRIDHATIFQNGLDNPPGPWPGQYGGEDTDTLQVSLTKFSVTDSYIEKIFIDWPGYPDGTRNLTSLNDPGARLSTRYVDGVLTSEPLWPWPMEDRIQAELGISVTNLILPILNSSP